MKHVGFFAFVFVCFLTKINKIKCSAGGIKEKAKVTFSFDFFA